MEFVTGTLASVAGILGVPLPVFWGPNVLTTFFLLGALAVLRFVWTFVKAVYKYFLRPGKSLKPYGWAVVTGASDGIGAALVKQLAKRKIEGVVLMARSQDKLDALAEEVTGSTGVFTKVVPVDIGALDSAGARKIAEDLAELDIGLLINNAGVGYDHAKYFTELESERIDAILGVNVYGITALTRELLPGIVARNKAGAVINVSSASGNLSEAMQTVYSASKAYVQAFSEALDKELANTKVRVQCSIPLLVATKLSKIRKASFMVASPSEWASACINAIGYERVSVPQWRHALQFWLTHDVLPRSLVDSFLLSRQKDIRKRALKKKERLAKEAKSE